MNYNQCISCYHYRNCDYCQNCNFCSICNYSFNVARQSGYSSPVLFTATYANTTATDNAATYVATDTTNKNAFYTNKLK